MKPSGLYVHVPFCSGKCAYCAFYSIEHDSDLCVRFVRSVLNELDAYIGTDPGFAPETVYIGGGTPTLLSVDELALLCDGLVDRISVPEVVEWSVEANPETLTAQKLDVLVRHGVNRISLGAQSFRDDVLRLLGRRHSCVDTHEAAGLIKDSGISNFGLDLIACVPGKGGDAWRATLEEAAGLGPNHISVYGLTVEEGTQLAVSTASGGIAAEDDDAQLVALHEAESVLGASGYGRYEISNYAVGGYECLHNLSCWRGCGYVGLGPSASSYAGNRRWKNSSDVREYVSVIESGSEPPRECETLSKNTIADEMLVFGLRMAEGVVTDELVRKSGCGRDREKKWVELLTRLSESGLLVCRDTRWTLTSRGRDLADYVAAELLQ